MRTASAPLYTALYSQVLIGIVLGIAFGYLWPKAGAAAKPLADGFIVGPVVFCTIVI